MGRSIDPAYTFDRDLIAQQKHHPVSFIPQRHRKLARRSNIVSISSYIMIYETTQHMEERCVTKFRMIEEIPV